MSQYINVGAVSANGERFPSKSALRKALATGETVMFDQTSAVHSGRLPGNATLTEIPDDVILSVCGPDPYTNRKWYGEVTKNRNGEFRVS